MSTLPLEKRAEIFLKRAKETFGDRFDYTQVIYTGSQDKVKFICKEHGEF